MLNSLEIRNYRNLKGLTIPSLGKVNLITGKNNTGKSTVLEAIAIYVSKVDLTLIYELLEERGENYRPTDANNSNNIQLIFNTWCSLFTGRVLKFNRKDAISIGETENSIFGETVASDKAVILRFVRYINQIEKDEQGNSTQRQIVLDNEKDKHVGLYRVGVEIWNGGSKSILAIDDESWKSFLPRFGITANFQFIRPRNIDRAINGTLWDKIAFTDKDIFVIEALKIIESAVEKIAFVGENRTERAAMVKLSNFINAVPLRSMGDGMNRILTIILALINADNGFLLIDEFENGLHYTVQKQLWNIVFNLASRLNVQVFATTHSEDCIRSFESVLNDPAISIEGKLIRLDNINGVIKQVEFNANEIKIANSQNIEIR